MLRYRILPIIRGNRTALTFIRSFSSKSPDPDSKNDLNSTFEPLDTSSLVTMEKILGILKDAEGTHMNKKNARARTGIYEPFDEKDILNKNELVLRRYGNKFSTTLGQELFTYNVIKLLNDKEIILNNPAIWENDFQTCIPIYNAYIEKFKQEFNSISGSLFTQPETTYDGQLNSYQAITKYFIDNKSKCHNMIKKDLRRLSKNIITHKYSNFLNHVSLNLPKVKIPNTFPYGTDTPLIIQAAVPVNKNELNLLPFLLPDDGVLNKFFRNQEIETNMIQSVMVAQQLEGFYIFRIMVKKHLQILNELENRELIRNFIQNDTSNTDDSDIEIIKAIIASMSKIPSRISYLSSYQSALQYHNVDTSNDKHIIKIMSEYFDRFIGILYRINPKLVDEWVTKFLAYYIEHANTDSIQRNLSQSLKDFKLMIDTASIEGGESKWNGLQKNKKDKTFPIRI